MHIFINSEEFDLQPVWIFTLWGELSFPGQPAGLCCTKAPFSPTVKGRPWQLCSSISSLSSPTLPVSVSVAANAIHSPVLYKSVIVPLDQIQNSTIVRAQIDDKSVEWKPLQCYLRSTQWLWQKGFWVQSCWVVDKKLLGWLAQQTFAWSLSLLM